MSAEPPRARGVETGVKLRLAFFVLQVGCAAVVEPGEASAPEDPVAPAGSIAVVPDATPTPKRREPAPELAAPTCEVKTEPRIADPVLTAPPETRACRNVAKKTWSRAQKDLRARWHPRFGRKYLDIEPGCDRLGDELAEIVFETSSGHGGSLHLVQLRPTDTGDFELLWLDYEHYLRGARWDEKDPWKADAVGEVAIRRGRLAADRFAPILERARVLVHAQVTEREPPPKKDSISLGGMYMSSRNYHAVLRLVDADGHGREDWFAGYESTGSDQAHGVPLDLVAQDMWTVLGDETFVASLETVAASDPDARTFFSRRLWIGTARGEEFGYWYVRERLLGLSAVLGSAQHVPLLLDVAAREGDASDTRGRVLAVNAIAAITGFDVRYEGDAFRPVDTVTRETLAACKP